MSKPTSSKPCLTCGGRGVISSGTDDVKCEACSGTEEKCATIFINKLQFTVDKPAITGADLRELVGSSAVSDHELIHVAAGAHRRDLLVHDDEVVKLADGAEFVTVPSSILAGRQRDAIAGVAGRANHK